MGESNKLSTALRAKQKRLKTVYNQTLEEHDAKREEQNHACAICKRAFRDFQAYQDHDHACCPRRKKVFCGKCNRGLLCYLCNKRAVAWLEYMGKVGIDPEVALKYMKDWTIKIKERGGYAKEEVKTKKLRGKQKSV